MSSHRLHSKQFFNPPILLVTMGILIGLGFYLIHSLAATLVTVSPPTNIATNCSVNVQPELAAWFASLGSNTIVELKPNACYLVEDQIVVSDKSNFYLHGNNATIKRSLPNGSVAGTNHIHFRFNRITNLNIRDINIQGIKQDTEGYNSGREAQHGFGLYGINGGTIDHVWINQIYGDCFYLNGGTTNGFTRFMTIKNSYCNQTGRHGMAIIAANDIYLTGNTFQLNHRENFDFEPNGGGRGGANNITIDHNTIGEGSQLLVSISQGSPDVKNFVFTNNIVHRRFTIVIESASGGVARGPITITGNTSDKPVHGNSIALHGINHAVVANNSIAMDGVNNNGDPNAYLVNLFTSKDVRVFGNTIPGARSALTTDALSSNYCEYGNKAVYVLSPICSFNSLWEAENSGSFVGAHKVPDTTASSDQSIQFAPIY